MDIETIIILIFCPILMPMYLYAILLMFGIGGSLLAGYNMSTKNTSAKQEHKYILRTAGICIFILLLIIHSILILFVIKLIVWGCIMIGVFAVWIVAMLLILNRKKMKEKLKIVLDNKLDGKNSHD